MKTSLPIDSSLAEICDLIRKNPCVIVSAAPGAGKTTRLPPEISQLTEKQVWVLEPRRIAAVAASSRIAEENGWQLGQEVGYQVRFENRSSSKTRLLFLTEALLLRKLLRDPELKDVGCVVLDEFHERSLHVDLALGALRELQALARPDLKIVVMSATLNAAPLSKYLDDAPVVNVPGRVFPLTVKLEDKAQLLRVGPDFTERMRKLVMRAVNENPEGDVLCFLPGFGEIERVREALDDWSHNSGLALRTLHGRLNLQDQRAAIEPIAGQRKIVLATNVAESSLTVEGVRIVVDSGLARLVQIHPRTGFESLDLVRISRASSTQRSGRAARTGPGVVYRAWTTHDELSMKEFELAEIFRSELSESLLLLSALGVTSFENFSWFEVPPAKALNSAKEFLVSLGALQASGELTDLGQEIREIPLHPRLAKLLLIGKKQGHRKLAAEMAALLSEKSSSVSTHGHENDLFARWEDWRRQSGNPRYSNLRRAADQLGQIVGASERESAPSSVSDWMSEILLQVYPDRLCRRRRPREPQAKMVGGRGVKLHPESGVKNSEYFLALELSEGREASETLVFQAAGVSEKLIEQKLFPLSKPAVHLEWNDDKNQFWVNESREWQGLAIGKETQRPAQPGEIQDRLFEVAWDRWDQLLEKNEELAQWLMRLEFLNRFDSKWSLLSDEQKRGGLSQACYGEKSLNAIYEKDLVSFFEGLLEKAHRDALHRECPASWIVPTGNRMKIRYSAEQGAQVEVRLQELFGLKSQPVIAGQNLTLVLLAPNFRPVQVTRDLESFWKNGYVEVRKEMRARYPKHSWPEDPLTAPPQSKGRPR